MGGYSLPYQDPATITPQSLYGVGFGPYSYGSPGIQQSSMGFDVSSPYVDVNPGASMEDIYASNRNVINTNGNQIGAEAGQQLGYYGPLQQNYQNAQSQALNDLQQTPGFNPQESGQIGADYSQYNTSPDALNAQFLSQGEQAGARGDPNAPVNAVNQGIGAEGAFLNQYQSDLGAQLGQYAGNLGSAAQGFDSGVGGAAADASGGVNNAYGSYRSDLGGALSGAQSGVRGAYQGLGQGLSDAQSKFSGLDAAVYDPSLGFDPNGTEKQLSDQDVSDIRTQAGLAVGNQFRTAEDTLERQAAQAGNTSPAALAAMRQSLATQNAATAGDAESNAQINALQAQYGRAAGIEGQRLGAAQTQQGLRATASTTEEAAAQAAAGLQGQSALQGEQFLGSAGLGAASGLGQAGLSSQEYLGGLNTGAQEAIGQNWMGATNNLGQANLNAVNQYGQFSTGQANTMTGQNYQAQSTAEQLAAQRAAQLAANRQATQANVNQTQYSQGTGSQQLNSQGQQVLGGARIAGQGAYRSGVAGQQSLAQQGGQAAQQTQLGAYGTQTSGLNSNASGQGNFEVGKPSLGDQLGKSVAGLFAEGGVATKPTLAKLGEKGPEIVVPLGGRYRSQMAA